ncbi:extradiol ring-cleavage dioxygenase [Martelella soudanensis]|uniref:extradiol ring-cleavage dioxygenase n=1 Tax=unclassified Martelella TaxID=2629616 RepID=UPI0015DDD86F|nr:MULTISPECIES: extradiol ring-cleavage dioxygenase [unclassified Martelella]
MSDALEIPETPLFERERAKNGYLMNKMAMSLGRPENRAAFRADEEAFLDSFGLADAEKQAVMSRDWHRMVALGGNLFFILKIAAIDPVSMAEIGAAQAQMSREDFLKTRLGKM